MVWEGFRTNAAPSAPAHERRPGRSRSRSGRSLTALLCLLLFAAPAPAQAVFDPPRGELRVVVLGDLNGPYGATAYADAVHRAVAAIVDVWRPDLVLLPGDLVAGQSRALPDERFAAMWAAFDAAIAAPLRAAGVPYAAALGNHDASKLRDADGAYAFARERAAAALDDVPFAWPFRLGPLFVAVVDASGPVVDDRERAALAAALASPSARSAALRWVVGHLPLLGVAEGRDRDGEALWRAEELRDLLVAGDVDTYLGGHQGAFYAAAWGGLELLFAPGAVGGRALRGAGLAPRNGLLVVDVGFDPFDVAVLAIDPATLAPYPAGAVPPRLSAFGAELERSPRVR
ncbi:MAG: metallophosphoesterase [Trueperaceae bacterium]|nr:metallophosphoesterase [Trueperaceae bacterium]